MHHDARRLSRIRERLCVREKVCQGVAQRGDPLPSLAARGRDRQHVQTKLTERGGEFRLTSLRLWAIEFVEGNEGCLLEQGWVMRLKLRANDRGVTYRVGSRRVHHVYQHARARGVSQEGEAKSRTNRCPLNQPWEIGNSRSTPIINAQLQHT